MSPSWVSDSGSGSGAEDEDDGARDPSRRIFHGDGTQSRVYRQLVMMPDGRSSRFIAIKVVSFVANSSTKPHDIVKEARLLQDSCDHPNIISPYDFIENDFREQYELIMPLLPLSLTTLLESPEFATFSPTEDPPPISPADHLLALPSHSHDERISWLEILAKSISFQIILALDYLHGLKVPIAHRDVKPGNVLLDKNGCVKLIDFGIAWECVPIRAPSHTAKKEDASPYDIPEETPEAMVCQVGSGSYRAIELLFSPPTYDARAADLWSLGVTLCMFYTELRWVPSSMADDESDDDEEERLGNRLSGRRWSRKSMFKASRGEIGLIWDIFRLLGTPTEESWPSFTSLPGAHSLSFNATPASDIRSRLAYLPPSSELPSGSINPEDPLDLIEKLIVLDPSRRLPASRALRHPWFWTGEPLLLPPGFPQHMPDNIRLGWVVDEWEGWSLRDVYKPGVERAWARYRDAL